MKLKSVLFVDDERTIHDHFTKTIEFFADEIYNAYNGIEALKVFEEKKPQLIISDINMPKLNGIELCKKIKELNPHQFFVFFSAHNELSFLHEAIKLNVNGFLLKPLKLENLKAVISKIQEEIYLKEQLVLKEEIEEKNILFQSIFNGISDSLCLVDKNCNILVLNENAKKVLSKKVSNGFDSKQRCAFISNDLNSNQIFCPYENTIKTNKSHHAINTCYDEEGNKLIEEVSISPIKGNNEEIIGFLEHRKDITKTTKMQEKIYHDKHYDALTNLINEYTFQNKLDDRIKKALDDNQKLAVLIINIDNLYIVNDSFGNISRDKVVKHFVFLINTVLENSVFGRISTSCFGIICENIEIIQKVDDLLKNIKDKLESNPFEIYFNKFFLNFSCGISVFPQDGDTSQILIKNANIALSDIKQSSKVRYKYFNKKLSTDSLDKVILQSHLINAVKNNEFELNYQPQYNSINNTYIGAEVLIRWKKGLLGFVSPFVFIPILEKLNLIDKVGTWIIKTVFKNVSLWNSQNLNTRVISINVSVSQLENKENFIQTLKELLFETKVNPNLICFEITESMLMQNHKEVISTLEEISKLGFHLSLDDFGTGYSSLSMLKKLPVGKLKIDKSFIDGLPHDSQNVVLTKTTIDLAKNLNLKVIAEGVELKEQLDFLKAHGCYEIQGFYFSKPLIKNDFISLLKNNNID